MIRLFDTHYIRKTQELDGMWFFSMEGFDKSYQMPVPGCWEQHPDFLKYRGKGTYTKKVYIDQKTNLRLEFKGVSHTADVYFDGEKISHHYNAFTPFSAIVKEVEKGLHEIKVEVDNTFGEHSALHIPNDYYTYGGITRPVALEQLADVYVKQLHFTPMLQDGIWKAKIEVTLCNLSEKTMQVALSCELENPTSATAERSQINSVQDAPEELQNCINENVMRAEMVELAGDSEQTFYFEQTFADVESWSGQNPKLYFLNTTLSVNGEVVDDLIERVGFRQVEVKGTQIYLNGEKMYLKGFNRHEDYATVGCAIPLQLMVQDMDMMQEIGSNAVRTCHYPNDERFLDLCDERGMLVWEENHARGLKLPDMLNPNFEQQCEDCIREMIENHYNHPSIVIWGILNECASETEEGRRMYKKQYEQIKSLDTSRPTTSATCRHFTDICLDLPDVVSFNMYSGWYKNCPVDERNTQQIEWIREAGGADKPIIVSELGAAAIYGYRDRARVKWSEERQADIIRENLEVYMTDENITGVFIWQFADCRVTDDDEVWFATRARSHNNKGVVDEYRRPKIAYDVVKELFEKYHA